MSGSPPETPECPVEYTGWVRQAMQIWVFQEESSGEYRDTKPYMIRTVAVLISMQVSLCGGSILW